MEHETVSAATATDLELVGRRVLEAGPRVMTLVLEGEIDRLDLPDILGMVERFQAGGLHRLVVDLTHVTHFDFRGVKPLIAHAERLRARGGDLKLAGLSSYVFAIFRSAGGNDAFDYFARVDDARASFSKPSRALLA